jgi:hypothetical protein
MKQSRGKSRDDESSTVCRFFQHNHPEDGETKKKSKTVTEKEYGGLVLEQNRIVDHAMEDLRAKAIHNENHVSF